MNTFITGGSRGIGRAIIRKMVDKGCGCSFAYRDDRQAVEETIQIAKVVNPEAIVKCFQMDVINSAEVEWRVMMTIDDFKDIGIVVNNASVVRNNAAFMMSDDEWEVNSIWSLLCHT
ncbi:MAG: SDR family NAD(P)-dependent oxidoreductase [Chloroflexota bacterium]|nr:SDR family NAD(P)-dependent oxidoreductase [Chloroflexota bacterium]